MDSDDFDAKRKSVSEVFWKKHHMHETKKQLLDLFASVQRRSNTSVTELLPAEDFSN